MKIATVHRQSVSSRTCASLPGIVWHALLLGLVVFAAGCSGSPGQSGEAASSRPAAESRAMTPADPTAQTEAEARRSQRSASERHADSQSVAQPFELASAAGERPAGASATPQTLDDVAPQTRAATDAKLQKDLIQSVIDNFNRLDEFDSSQVFPQMRDRLNQWMWQSRPATDWKPDPLLSTLDPSLGTAPIVQFFISNFDRGLFNNQDMIALQEAIWQRDIARMARGSQLDDLSVAEQLFDWTVRNLQLVADPAPGSKPVERSPIEILLLGRATARERAWIFLLLLRQQGLDGAVLAIPAEAQARNAEASKAAAEGDAAAKEPRASTTPADTKAAAKIEPAAMREWVVALVSDQDLYLFDPTLGMPLPGAAQRVATLAEMAADDNLLRALDLSSKTPYPVKAEELAHLVAYVEASPATLSRRMEALEAELTGDQRVILATRPQRLAERLAAFPQIGAVRYWPLPYEYWQARGGLKPGEMPAGAADLMVFRAVPPLAKARELHFKGKIDGDQGAKSFYMKSRLSKQQVAQLKVPLETKQIWDVAKQDASYWLGLIAFEQKNYPVADDFLRRRTLEMHPAGPWTDGAHYNLARTYEAGGQLPEAIELYQSDRSPQSHGNRLRARRLKAQASAEPPAGEKKP